MIYAFSDCELDTRLYTLCRIGQTARLSPRVYKLLMYLLEHRDRVVSKDELCDQVWPNQFIANATLESAIRLVRRAIGDTGRAQRVIETSWGYGYRFIAPVVERASDEGQTPAPSPMPPPSAIHPLTVVSPFVGRQQELELLHALMGRVERSRGQVVGVVGAPGIGKSRLLSEFVHSLQGERVRYVEGRCFPNRKTMPYLPLLDVIRQSFDVAAGDSPQTITAKVHSSLQEIGLNPEDKAPYLLRVLGMQEGMDRLANSPPELLRVRTIATLCQMLLASSRLRPIIVAIEDLHWIDHASEDCIASLIAHLADAPVLLLLTFRPAYRPAWLQTAPVTQIVLSPLTSDESLSVVQAGLGEERIPADLEHTLLTEATGNPLFLEECTRCIIEREDSETDVTIQGSLQDLLVARLNRLPDGPKRLLQTAAVLGPTFSRRLLEAVWDGSHDFEPCLLELAQRSLLSTQHNVMEPVYAFKHELIQAAAYEELSSDQRQALHAAAGQALEVLHGAHSENISDLLAYHAAQTGQAAKAIASFTRLAALAVQKGAHNDAVASLQEALEYVIHLPQENQTHRRLDLTLSQAQSLVALRRFQEAVALLTQQWESHSPIMDDHLRGRYALLLSQTHSTLREWASAAQYAQRALEAATRCHDEATIGQSYYVLAQERYWSGNPSEGVECCQHAISRLRQSEERPQLGMAYFILGLNYHLVGDFARALQAAEQAHAIGAAIEDRLLLTFVAWTRGWIHSTCGEWEAGITACQQGLACAPDPLSTALAMGWLGYAYLEHGEPAEAISLLEQAVPQMCRLHHRRLEGLFSAFLGEAYLLQNNPNPARDLVQQSLSIAQETGYRVGIAWAQRSLGRIARATNAPQEAERHLNEALATFALMQARFETGRAHLELAELMHLQGRREASLAHLTEAATLFKALPVPKYTDLTEQRARAYGLALSQDPLL